MKTIETIIIRILFLIPFTLLALIGILILFGKYMINYVRFGGESIAYTEKNTRKTIKDIYDKLNENEPR